jgi:polar amino acid transport system substrate-binding protein
MAVAGHLQACSRNFLMTFSAPIRGEDFMLYRLTGLAAAMLLASALPAAADRQDDVRARGKHEVGFSDTTPPCTFKKPGESVHMGYDIDVVRAVARRLGVTVETVSVTSAERIPMLKDGKLDFVATSMTRTPERLKDVDFSVIYFVTPHAVIVRKASGITSVSQLAGKKASSASTSTAGGNLKEAAPGVEIVYVRDYAIAFAMLKEGKVDAFPTDESVLRAIVQQDGNPNEYVFLSDFTKSRNVGFALKKGEPRFKDAIDKALLDIEASGEAAKIFDAWFGPGTKEPMARKFRIQPD